MHRLWRHSRKEWLQSMEEKVFNIINNSNKALTYEEIMDLLDLDEKDELGNVLVELQKKLKIRYTNKGKYEKNNDCSTDNINVYITRWLSDDSRG